MNDEKEGVVLKYSRNKVGKVFIICYENEGVYHAYPIENIEQNIHKHFIDKEGQEGLVLTPASLQLLLNGNYTLTDIEGGKIYFKEDLTIIKDGGLDSFNNEILDISLKLLEYLLINKKLCVDANRVELINVERYGCDTLSIDVDYIGIGVYFIKRNGDIKNFGHEYFNCEDLLTACLVFTNTLIKTDISNIEYIKNTKLNNNRSFQENLDLSELCYMLPLYITKLGRDNCLSDLPNISVIKKIVEYLTKYKDKEVFKFLDIRYDYFVLICIELYMKNSSSLYSCNYLMYFLDSLKFENLLLCYFSKLHSERDIINEIDKIVKENI